MSIKILTDTTFDAIVKDSKIPVVVDFWAEWCGPCKMIAPVLEKLAKEYDGQILIGKVDIDSNTSLAELYEVRSIPTLIVFIDGEPKEMIIGAQKDIIETTIKGLV